eukprot:366172-Chlamydomonas_euryale.AAC.6
MGYPYGGVWDRVCGVETKMLFYEAQRAAAKSRRPTGIRGAVRVVAFHTHLLWRQRKVRSGTQCAEGHSALRETVRAVVRAVAAAWPCATCRRWVTADVSPGLFGGGVCNGSGLR